MANRVRSEVNFAFGHRLTFTLGSHVGQDARAAATKVDVYPFHPPIQAGSPDPLRPLAWVLYVPPAQKSRHAVPGWLHDLCQRQHWPLVTVDHHGLPLTAVLEELLVPMDGNGSESLLTWSLLATGPGAQADSGTDALDERYYFDFVPHGGLDPQRMALVLPSQGGGEARIWPQNESLPPPRITMVLYPRPEHDVHGDEARRNDDAPLPDTSRPGGWAEDSLDPDTALDQVTAVSHVRQYLTLALNPARGSNL